MGENLTEAGRRYALVSPCRNEAEFLRRTLDSVAAQSLQPSLWVIVDDGSTDDTPRILEEYAKRLPYLRIVHRQDRGRRAVGPGVIEAFYDGLNTIDLSDFDFLCKLDVDLDLPERYFEELIERMEADPRLGTCSGKPWFDHPVSGKRVPEVCGDEMSVGMTKLYKVSCFRDIGGFVREVMWDGIDCHRARMLGWKAKAFNDESLRFLHLRAMGSSDKNILRGRVRSGFGNYFMGTSPLYLAAIAVNRLFQHPTISGSLATIWGYLLSAMKGLPRYEDREFRRFLRRYQHMSLVVGKTKAIARLDAERAGGWEQRYLPAKGRGNAGHLGSPPDVKAVPLHATASTARTA